MTDVALIERLARERNRILLFSIITYGVWYGAFILRDTGGFESHSRQILEVIVLAFSLLWALCCAWLVYWLYRLRSNPKARAALNDEMTVRNRWRAQRASAFTLLVCLCFGVVITSRVNISGRLAMEMLIWVLVISQLGFYLWFDRSE